MNRLVLGFVPGVVLGAAALRRHGDLGDTVPASAFWTMLLLGVVLLGWAAHWAAPHGAGERAPVAPVAWSRLVGAALGLVWMLAIPTETALATVALGACWLCARAAGARGLRRSAVRVLEFALFVWLVLLVTNWFVDAISLMRVTSAHGADLVATMLGWFGVEAASSGAQVFLSGPRADQGFLVTANNTGLVPHLAVAVVLVGWRLLGAPSAGSGRWWAAFGYLPTALLLGFVLFMVVGIALDHTAHHDNQDFDLAAVFDWRVGLVMDLVAGVAAASIWFCTKAATGAAQDAAEQRAPRPLLLAVAVAAGVLWSSDRILDALGQPAADQPVRVAMDELHSHWESSDIHLTRDHYGQESGYNFRGLCGWLEGGYGPIRRLYDATSDATLADVDVLVIKTPTQAFAPEEQAAIDRFVQRGGGLVLIGDHTNVYGTSEVLNALAEPCGFRFVYDCCFDQRSRFEFRYVEEAHVAGHATLAGLDEILFEVGCTIDIDSPRVRPILVGRSLKSQPIDYGVENYYGKPRDRSEQECGQFPILVVANRGKGRVVAIADSTLFSTFSVFMPGRREIVEGMIAHASGHDVGATFRELAWRIAIGITLLLFLVLLPGAGASTALTCCLLAWGACNLSTAVAEGLVRRGLPDLATANAPATVTFLRQDESVEWPTLGFSDDPSRCFSLFYQFVSRVGAYPRLVEGLAEALAAPGPVVWIDPVAEDPARTAEELVTFARGGGTVILMEREPRPVLSAVAQSVGLRWTDAGSDGAGAALVSRFGHASELGAVPPVRGILGGRSLLRVGAASDGPSVAAVQEVGAGRVVLVTCGALFADSRYGFRYGTIPSPSLRRLYEVQYSILQTALREGTER